MLHLSIAWTLSVIDSGKNVTGWNDPINQARHPRLFAGFRRRQAQAQNQCRQPGETRAQS